MSPKVIQHNYEQVIARKPPIDMSQGRIHLKRRLPAYRRTVFQGIEFSTAGEFAR
jgi:hypothetical protein